MVEVKKSNCHCGKCGMDFLVVWELETMDTSDNGPDMGIYYYGQIEEDCPSCGNKIIAELQAIEKPVGVLEHSEITHIEDAENTGLTSVEKPEIFFFDI